MSRSPTRVLWLRRDLRLHDHPALAAATEAERLGVLYVLDPRLVRGPWSSSNRTWYLLELLRRLDEDLRELGSELIVRVGDPTELVPRHAAEVGAATVEVSADVSPYAARRDRAVREGLEGRGIALRQHPGLLVHDPGEVLTRDGRPYVVFGPYRRAWETHRRRPLAVRPDALPPPPPIAFRHPIPTLSELGLPEASADPATFPEPGERAARERMATWLAGPIREYAADRDRLDLGAGTSRLSQDLRFGVLSPLELVELVEQAEPAADRRPRASVEGDAESDQRTDGRWAWLSELCWRDFYLQLLHHHPTVLERPFREAFSRLRWADDPDGFEAWRDGRTGYPVVDAAMRQLAATGFMPNRARMIVASFLAKDLLLDWRRGESHFMRHLVDGEPAANDGGWQWSASSGTDAQPWFRVFDPVTQGRRFDPDGTYVRRWIPELAGVPVEHVHAPWTMPPGVQASSRCRIGRDYPGPIVDHAAARARWLDAVADAGIAPGGIRRTPEVTPVTRGTAQVTGES